MDPNRIGWTRHSLDLHAESFKTTQRTETVGAARKIFGSRHAVGDRSDQRGPMGYGLVSRHPGVAPEPFCRQNFDCVHDLRVRSR